MKKSGIVSFVLSLVVMFVMPMAAHAQFGGIGKKLKDAAQKKSTEIVDKAQTNPQAALNDAQVAKSGGLQKYLGLDDAAGQTVWRYYEMHKNFTSGKGDKNYTGGVAELGGITGTLIEKYKELKDGDKDAIANDKMCGNFPGLFNSWTKKAKDVTTWDYHPVPSADAAHFIEVFERMRALYNQRAKEYDL